jgi:cysteine desulfurase/selenocysteine lyase
LKWVNTMNTNEPKAAIPGAASGWTTVLSETKSLPAGLPDPSVLARMAHEFFTALPRTAPAGLPPSDVLQIPTVPTISETGTEPQLSHPPASSGAGSASGAESKFGTTVPNTITPVPQAGIPAPAIAGGFVEDDSSRGPGFSFLEEARPLFPSPAGYAPAGKTPNSPAKPREEFSPSQPGYGAIPSTFEENALPIQLAEFSQPPTPTIPASFGVADSSAVPTFAFMEEARPLFSLPPAMPGPVPAAPAEPEKVRGVSAEEKRSKPHTETLDVKAADIRSPQVPGTVTHPAGFQPASSYDSAYLYPRPILSEEKAPELPGSHTGALPDLELPSYSFDVETIRRDFPILRERVHGRPLIWLDNAATTQKPQSVIDRLSYFYTHENSNVHRAAHELAARATDAYESAREKVRRFLNAPAVREIVFVRGATEGINLLAQSWGRRNVHKDDEIVITWLEHHANIVPWQMLCAEKGARLRVAPVDDRGQVILDEYEKLLGPKTRLVSLPQVSNALGTVTPVHAMIEAAHRHGTKVLVDGAQAVSHMRVDVQDMDCDFYVFSGHKLFAPTGIGVVYGKSEILDVTPPWQGGGSMIADVTFEKTVYQPPPQRFEAGTGNIADAIGLGAAIDYLDRVGMVNISRHEHELLSYGTAGLERIPGLHIIGKAKEKAGVLSFILDGFRTEEIGDFLNQRGIAVRAGHHCAQPIHRRFGLESTLRASLALYNTLEEIDALIAALWDLKQGRNPGLA